MKHKPSFHLAAATVIFNSHEVSYQKPLQTFPERHHISRWPTKRECGLLDFLCVSIMKKRGVSQSFPLLEASSFCRLSVTLTFQDTGTSLPNAMKQSKKACFSKFASFQLLLWKRAFFFPNQSYINKLNFIFSIKMHLVQLILAYKVAGLLVIFSNLLLISATIKFLEHELIN